MRKHPYSPIPKKKLNKDNNKLHNYVDEIDYNSLYTFDKNLVIVDNPKLENMLKSSTCIICLNIPYDPLECIQCSAVFCPPCRDGWKINRNICPACNKYEFATKKAFHVKTSLELFKIKCCNPGCNEKINFTEYKAHLINCPYKRYKCTNENCKFVAKLNEIIIHANQCDYLKIKCEECGKEIIQKDVEEHKNDPDCLKKQIQKLNDKVNEMGNKYYDLLHENEIEKKKNEKLEIQVEKLKREKEQTAQDLKKIFDRLSD